MRTCQSKLAASTGHTLIEITIVLGIMAVLTAAAMQGWQHLVRRQQRAEAKAAVLQVMQQQESHRSRHGRYQPFDLTAPGSFKWHSGPTPAESAYAISAVACAGMSTARCVTVLAQPGGAGVRPECHLNDPGAVRSRAGGDMRATDGFPAAALPAALYRLRFRAAAGARCCQPCIAAASAPP